MKEPRHLWNVEGKSDRKQADICLATRYLDRPPSDLHTLVEQWGGKHQRTFLPEDSVELRVQILTSESDAPVTTQ